jgi:hypothetical protein
LLHDLLPLDGAAYLDARARARVARGLWRRWRAERRDRQRGHHHGRERRRRGRSCEPPECIEGYCTAYACSEQGECLPFDSFYCQSQLDACAGLLCEDECIDPFCNDGGLEEGGMCAPAFCNVDVACVPIARFEMTPCEGPPGDGSSSGGGSSSTGTAGSSG